MKLLEQFRLISRIGLLLYLGAVFTLCLINMESVPELPMDFLGIPLDKWAHFIMFLPYPILAYISFRPDRKGVSIHLIALAAIIAVGAAMSMGVERLQIAAGRNYDIKDFYANIAGMAAGAAITLIFILARHRLDK